MPTFDIPAAYDYYDRHINRTERFDLLRRHQFAVPGSIPSIDWELFGVLLTGDERKATGYGSDLTHFEIKSAVLGGSFEYQYHKHGGVTKLEEDQRVSHIFIVYAPDYQDVTVRIMPAAQLAGRFEAWRDELVANYQAGRQRYRRSIPAGLVRADGELIMEIRGGQLVSTPPSAG